MPVSIDSDSVYIRGVNFTELGQDPAAPGLGHAIIYVKSGGVYVRHHSGAAALVGSSPALTANLLGVGDSGGLLSPLSAGATGAVPTRQADGTISEVVPQAGSSGGLTSLATVTVSGSDATTLAFTNIPSGHKALLIVAQLRGDKSATYQLGYLQFNADSANHYAGQAHAETYAAAIGPASGAMTSAAWCLIVPANSADAGLFGMYLVDIPVPGTVVSEHIALSRGGFRTSTTGNNATYVMHGTAAWASTAAITAITITAEGTQKYKVNSTATLYGVD